MPTAKMALKSRSSAGAPAKGTGRVFVLPKPRYKIGQPKVVRGAHIYPVETKDGIIELRGVTYFTSIIAKPALVPWAQRETIEQARRELHEADTSDFLDDKIGWEEFIDKILERALKRPKEAADKAMDIGSRAHDYIEKWIKGEAPKEIPDDIKAPVGEFLKWVERDKIQFVASELPVACLWGKFATKIDALAIHNNELVLEEWKTSKGIWDEYALQCAAGRQAFLETYGIFVKKAQVVRFGKDGSFEKKWVLNLEESFEAFRHAHALKESAKEQKFVGDDELL